MHTLHDVIPGTYHTVVVKDLLFQRVLQLLDAFELQRIAGLQPHQLAGLRVYAVMQNELQHLAHVDIAGIRRSVRAAAARAGLDTAYDGPVAGLLDAAPLAQRHLHSHVVVKKSGVCLPLLDHAAALADQRLRRTVPHPDGHDRLRGLELIGGLQADVGQGVRRVLSIGRLAAHDQQLPHGIARE